MVACWDLVLASQASLGGTQAGEGCAKATSRASLVEAEKALGLIAGYVCALENPVFFRESWVLDAVEHDRLLFTTAKLGGLELPDRGFRGMSA